MDKYICKAKDIKTGEWVYGYYVAVSHFGHPEHVIIEEDAQYDGCGEFWHMDVHEVDPATVCQCTGLSDKNGTIIFENDCIGHKLNVVEYFDGSFCVNGDTPLCYMNKYYKVVGNRFS